MRLTPCADTIKVALSIHFGADHRQGCLFRLLLVTGIGWSPGKLVEPKETAVRYLPAAMAFFVPLAVLGIAVVFARRRRRRDRDEIERAITALGGRVTSIEFGRGVARAFDPKRHTILFLSRDGDLRQVFALVSSAGMTFENERPYQQYFAEVMSKTESPMLRALFSAGENKKLPGYAAYTGIIRQLASGLESRIEMREDGRSTPGSESASFAAVLQCVEWDSAGVSSPGPGLLDLVCDGRPLQVGWRVEGRSPDRVLILTEQTPADAEGIRSNQDVTKSSSLM